MTLPIGSLGYVDYGEVPRVVHARLILGHVDANNYVILTPDHHIYEGCLNADENEDIVRFWPGSANGAPPRAIPAASIYGFAPMTAGQVARFMQLGATEVGRMRGERGIVDPAGVGAGAPPVVAGGDGGSVHDGGAGVAAADDGSYYVLAEMVVGRKIGERVVPPVDAPKLGDFALMMVTDGDGKNRPCLTRKVTDSTVGDFCDERIVLARASASCEGVERSASEDVRTIEVRYGFNGERQRSFRESVKELVVSEFEDFPLQPRTTLDYVRAVASVAESATAQHHIWVNSSGIPSGDRSVYEDQVLARILDEALCYDSLNVANLACMELVCRRRQLIADAHAAAPGTPSYLGAEHYLGETYKHGGGIVVPALTDHVSRKMQAQAQILKEKRKLAEASGKGGKNKSDKQTPKAPPAGKATGGGAS